MTQTMKLNVGGEVFEVAQATLKTSHDNFFSALLSRWSPDSSNPHFIDRDPQLFRYILAWLRDRKVVLPIGVSKQAVLKEAEYFSLPIDAEDVIIDYSQIADIRKRLCDADQQLATDHTALSNRMLVEATAHEIVLYAVKNMPGKTKLLISKASGLPEWTKTIQFHTSAMKEALNRLLVPTGYRLALAARHDQVENAIG
eukprot:TRINITY_DN42689_c0_g1_i2.p1 TRINITY_DN42689_c0_g1~~TRINITY_DN42689_c0_g1_i2.p1  ORF type:complete len:199 (+),score=41.64 TRINITY_DN42689_c0_g1_i2:49-645(+)